MDTKFVVIPCIVQITPKQHHVLDRVDFGRAAEFGKARRIRDTAWIALVDPLDIQC